MISFGFDDGKGKVSLRLITCDHQEFKVCLSSMNILNEHDYSTFSMDPFKTRTQTVSTTNVLDNFLAIP